MPRSGSPGNKPHVKSLRLCLHGVYPQRSECAFPTRMAAAERTGNNLKGFSGFCLNNGSRQGLDCLICAELARQRADTCLVFEAHRRVYHSTLGLRVIKKKKDTHLEEVDAEERQARV